MDRFDAVRPSRDAFGGGIRARVAAAVRRVFSLRAFVVAFALAAAGAFAGGAIPVVGAVGGLAGVSLAGFALGLAGPPRYVESALAGAATAGVAVVLDHLVLTAFVGPQLVAFGAGTGLLAAVVGHYLGRDLRAGLTREV